VGRGGGGKRWGGGKSFKIFFKIKKRGEGGGGNGGGEEGERGEKDKKKKKKKKTRWGWGKNKVPKIFKIKGSFLKKGVGRK